MVILDIYDIGNYFGKLKSACWILAQSAIFANKQAFKIQATRKKQETKLTDTHLEFLKSGCIAEVAFWKLFSNDAYL